jgi:tetratricopeptide (TPR) repeat protein
MSIFRKGFDKLFEEAASHFSDGEYHSSFACSQMALEEAQHPEQIAKSFAMMAESMSRAGGRSVTLQRPLPARVVAPPFQGTLTQPQYFQLLQLATIWWEKAGRKDQVVATLFGAAAEYMRRGDYPNASTFFYNCAYEARRAGDRHTFANVMGELGDLERAMGRPQEALKYTWNAYVMFDEEKSPQKQIADNVLREIEQELGHPGYDQVLAAIKKEPLLWQAGAGRA